MKNRRRGPRRLRGEGKEGKERRGGTMISRGSTLPSRCKQLLSNDTIFLGMLINAFDRVQKRPSFDEIGDAAEVTITRLCLYIACYVVRTGGGNTALSYCWWRLR